MASALIHMAVAKKVNEKLKLNERYILLGSIAPDAGKPANIDRKATHFIDENNDSIPNINLFLNKYKNKLKNDYEIGYLIHLLTDKLWFSEFIKNYLNNNEKINKFGEKMNVDDQTFSKLIYDDYTALDKKVLDYYNMDLSLFYENFDIPNTCIEEIPIKDLSYLVEKMSLLISNDYTDKETIFSIENIVQFIEYSTIYVLDELNRLEIVDEV